jgi:chitin disaccharide deacetylase
MLIVNADDLGRSIEETDLAAACFAAGRITSTTAMVFMEDSARAAHMARATGIDVGLHLNLSQPFTAAGVPVSLRRSHDAIVRFLSASRYAVLFYQPLLRRAFRDVVRAQLDEFARLYGRQPSHLDGHQHQHLCANVLLDGLLPEGRRIRRSFSFRRGEKNAVNRAFRALVDRRLARRHVLTDYFFSLKHCLRHEQMARVFALADTATVELMTHPVNRVEYEYLMSDAYAASLRAVNAAPRAGLCA